MLGRIRELMVILLCLVGCSNQPDRLPVPGGEADYCNRQPEATLCTNVSAR